MGKLIARGKFSLRSGEVSIRVPFPTLYSTISLIISLSLLPGRGHSSGNDNVISLSICHLTFAVFS